MDQRLKDVPKDQLLEAMDKALNIWFAIDCVVTLGVYFLLKMWSQTAADVWLGMSFVYAAYEHTRQLKSRKEEICKEICNITEEKEEDANEEERSLGQEDNQDSNNNT